MKMCRGEKRAMERGKKIRNKNAGPLKISRGMIKSTKLVWKYHQGECRSGGAQKKIQAPKNDVDNYVAAFANK